MIITQNSRWVTLRSDKIFYFTVVGIWYNGYSQNLRKIAYELKYEHTAEIQRIEAKKLEELISKKTVKPRD